MRVIKEDLWSDPKAKVIVTTNGALRKNGSLVMGRGAALQAAQKFPGIDLVCGKAIKDNATMKDDRGNFLYGFLPIPEVHGIYGIFQVKAHWSDPASLMMIQASTVKLVAHTMDHPDVTFRMNFPGIGNGRLRREQVEPLLFRLPDNVVICVQ